MKMILQLYKTRIRLQASPRVDLGCKNGIKQGFLQIAYPWAG
jgi:hypothetical protein